MVSSVQMVGSDDGQQVAADAADVGTHAVEQVAELLDIGFAGRIVDGGLSLGECGGHHDVGRTRHRSLVEQHVASLQPVGANLIDIALGHVAEAGSQHLEAQEVGVQSAASYLVASGTGDDGFAEAGQQRSDHEHRPSERGAFLHKVVALQIIQVQVSGTETVGVAVDTLHLNTDIFQQADEVVDVEDVGNVGDGHLVGGEQRGADDLQGLVFGSLRSDGTLQRVPSFDDECCHGFVGLSVGFISFFCVCLRWRGPGRPRC